MIVVDASLGLDLFSGGEVAHPVSEKVRYAGGVIAVPELFDLEILQILRRLVYQKRFEIERANEAIELIQQAPIMRFGHADFSTRIWDMRHNLTAYDAAYFALAEGLGVPLWTRDTKYTTIPDSRVAITVF